MSLYKAIMYLIFILIPSSFLGVMFGEPFVIAFPLCMIGAAIIYKLDAISDKIK